MQIVGLEVAANVAFERAASAIAEAASGDPAVATIREGSTASNPQLDAPATIEARSSTRQFTERVTEPHEALSNALDRLADDGIDYTFVESSLQSEGPTVAIDSDPDGEYLADVPPGTLDDKAHLESVLNRIDELAPYETLGSLVKQIQEHPDSPKAGALATFTGRVRAENLDSGRTTHLEYEKYEDVADQEMEAIRAELTNREGVYEVLMHHNTGIVPAEADAVHVVVLAGHRQEAFRAVEDGIDWLKDRVQIFKKEVTESGEYWAHDRP